MFQEAERAKTTYARHTDFRVGAFLRTNQNVFYTGNVAHTNSRLTMCAEMLALAQCKMLCLTPAHLYITSDSRKPIFPCGVCRQYASEFPKLKVTSYSCDGTKEITKTIAQLFPNPFQRN